MSRLSESDHAVYRGLVNVLLPASGSMPAAGQVAVAGEMLDRILGWRPDLAPELLRGIAKVREMEPEAALQLLENDDLEAFTAIRLAALGAYYLDPSVMEAIGYSGQQSRPVPSDETPDYLEAGLLEPVAARGAIWRKVSDSA
jgi:hypothetical protein